MVYSWILPMLLSGLSVVQPMSRNPSSQAQKLKHDAPILSSSIVLGTGLVAFLPCLARDKTLPTGSFRCIPGGPTFLHFQYNLKFPEWNPHLAFYYENIAVFVNGLGLKYYFLDDKWKAYGGTSLLWLDDLVPSLNAHVGLEFPGGKDWYWGTRFGATYYTKYPDLSLGLDFQLRWDFGEWQLKKCCLE